MFLRERHISILETVWYIKIDFKFFIWPPVSAHFSFFRPKSDFRLLTQTLVHGYQISLKRKILGGAQEI